MLNHLPPFPPARDADLDLSAALFAQRFGEQVSFRNILREEDAAWAGFVIVKLRQERTEHLAGLQGAIRLREVGPVAPVLRSAKEEHLDAIEARLLMDSEYVRFLNRARIDALVGLHGRKRREAIAVYRRTLVIERT